MYLVKKGQQLVSFTEQLHCKEYLSTLSPKLVDSPGKFTNCSTFLVLKNYIYCFLKSTFSF